MNHDAMMVDKTLLSHEQYDLSDRFDIFPLSNSASRPLPHCNVQTLAYINDRQRSSDSPKRPKRCRRSKSRSRSRSKRTHDKSAPGEPPTPGTHLIDGVDRLIKQKSRPRLCDENGNQVDTVDLTILDGEEFQLHNAHRKDLFQRVEERDLNKQTTPSGFGLSPNIGANHSQNNIKGQDSSLKSPAKYVKRSSPDKNQPGKHCYQQTVDFDDKSSPRRGYIDVEKHTLNSSKEKNKPRGESQLKAPDTPKDGNNTATTLNHYNHKPDSLNDTTLTKKESPEGQTDMNAILESLMNGKLATCIDTTSNDEGRLALKNSENDESVQNAGSHHSLVWSECPDSSPNVKPKRKKKRNKHRKRLRERNQSPNCSSGSVASPDSIISGGIDSVSCNESVSANNSYGEPLTITKSCDDLMETTKPNKSESSPQPNGIDRNHSASPCKLGSSEKRRRKKRKKHRHKEERVRHDRETSDEDKPPSLCYEVDKSGKHSSIHRSQSDTSIASSMSTILPSQQFENIKEAIEGKFRKIFHCHNTGNRPVGTAADKNSFFTHVSSVSTF